MCGGRGKRRGAADTDGPRLLVGATRTATPAERLRVSGGLKDVGLEGPSGLCLLREGPQVRHAEHLCSDPSERENAGDSRQG